jgi:hypothetical protein
VGCGFEVRSRSWGGVWRSWSFRWRSGRLALDGRAVAEIWVYLELFKCLVLLALLPCGLENVVCCGELLAEKISECWIYLRTPGMFGEQSIRIGAISQY